MRVTVVASLFAVVALAGAAAGNGLPAAPWIVFPASPDHATGGQYLYKMRLDGSGLQRLTRAPNASDPSFAPGGRRVVFARDGLFAINLDGSGVRRLTKNPSDHAPAWSPDGRTIAFVRAHHLYVMRADGKRTRRLPYAPAPVGRPSWSPDGRILVPAAAIPGGTQLVEVGARDGHVKMRLRLDVRARPDLVDPALSPNGRRVAFLDIVPCLECRSETYGLFDAPVAGTRASFVETAGIPSWSPDSTRLIYTFRGSFYVRTLSNGNAAPVPGLPESLIVSGPVAWQPR
jgi:Tol biopolymer transport system component